MTDIAIQTPYSAINVIYNPKYKGAIDGWVAMNLMLLISGSTI